MKKIHSLPVAFLLFSTIQAAPAPDFTVTASDGQVRKLYQDYVNQQKVAVLEIFFTTCPPCATHAPYLQALYQSMLAAHPGKVEFMLLSDKSADTNPVVASYLSSKGLTMPAAGADGGSLAAVQPYKNGTFGLFQGTPTFVVVAPGTGEVFYDIRGNSPEETMNLISQKISDLLPQQDCFLKSYFDNPLDDVQINIATAGGFDTSFVASGAYSLAGIPELQNTSYTIMPVKNSDPLQGLSTYDLVKITAHILGIQPFQYPWQAIAADMNCSGSVTTFDVVEGRKVILGITSGFSGCGGATWHFVAEPDGDASNGSCLNFRGIRLGDITGSYFGPGDHADDREGINLFSEDMMLKKGRTYAVQFRPEKDLRVLGLQMAFDVDPQVLEIKQLISSVLYDFDAGACNLGRQKTEGYAPLSWVSGSRVPEAEAEQPLFTAEIVCLRDARLSDALRLSPRLAAEIYPGANEVRPLALQWRDASAAGLPGVAISPNPAKGECFATFESGREADVLAQLVDTEGRVVFEKTYRAIKGTNRLRIAPEIPETGLFLLKLDGRCAGKIILSR